MLIKRFDNKFTYYFFLFFLILFTKVRADSEFYKCPDKISKVLSGKSSTIYVGSLIGTSYVKKDNEYVTIKFREFNDNLKSKILIDNKKIIKNSLGYEVFDKISNNNSSLENTYNFVKLDKTYAITRKEFFWSSNNEISKKNYEYYSTSRCIKIVKEEYDLEKKIDKIQKSKNVVKKIEKKQKVVEGQRHFVMSWDGYEELITGILNFSEKDLIGKIQFTLPNNNSCVGTYVLSALKGTWSIYCENEDLNASGTLKWNEDDGTVNGNGYDNVGKQIKFKVISQ